MLPWDFAQHKTFNFPKFIRSVILSGINSRSNRENGTYLSARGIWYDISSGRLSQGCRKLLTQTTEGQCHNNFSVFMSENKYGNNFSARSQVSFSERFPWDDLTVSLCSVKVFLRVASIGMHEGATDSDVNQPWHGNDLWPCANKTQMRPSMHLISTLETLACPLK